MGSPGDYQDNYRNYLADPNKAQPTPVPEGLDVSKLAGKVAAEGRGARNVAGSVAQTLQSGSLSPVEVEYLAQPQNTQVVIQTIAQSPSPVAVEYLSNLLQADQALDKALEISGLASQAEALSQAARVAQEGAAINQVAQQVGGLQSALEQATPAISISTPNNSSASVQSKTTSPSSQGTQAEVNPTEQAESNQSSEAGESGANSSIQVAPETSSQTDQAIQSQADQGNPSDSQNTTPIQADQASPSQNSPITSDAAPSTQENVLDPEVSTEEPDVDKPEEANSAQTTSGASAEGAEALPETGSEEKDATEDTAAAQDTSLATDQDQSEEQGKPTTNPSASGEPQPNQESNQETPPFDPEQEKALAAENAKQAKKEELKKNAKKGKGTVTDENLSKEENKKNIDEYNKNKKASERRKTNSGKGGTEYQAKDDRSAEEKLNHGRDEVLDRALKGNIGGALKGGLGQIGDELKSNAGQGLTGGNKNNLSARDKDTPLLQRAANDRKPLQGVGQALDKNDKNKAKGGGGALEKARVGVNSLKRAGQIASNPKAAAADALRRTRDAAFREVRKQIAGWLASTILPLLPWILLIVVVLGFVLSLFAGLLVVAYCYSDEFKDYGAYRIRAGLEYALTEDKSFLRNAELGAGLVFDRKVTVKSELGKIIENQVCKRLTGNACGALGNAGGGYQDAGRCLQEQLAGKSDSDTIKLWRAQGPVSQTDVRVGLVNEIISAGNQAGVGPNVINFTLSVVATESANTSDPWSVVNNFGGQNNPATNCYGLVQFCPGRGVDLDRSGNRTGWAYKAGLTGTPFEVREQIRSDKPAQMRVIAELVKEKLAIADSVPYVRNLLDGRSTAYKLGALNLGIPRGCDKTLKNSTCGDKSVKTGHYGEAAELNSKILTCQGTGENDIAPSDDITYQPGRKYSLDQITNFLASPNGLDFLANGGTIKAEANVPRGTYEYGGEEDQVLEYLAEGRIRDTIVETARAGGVVRPPLSEQIAGGHLHPNVLKAMVVVLQNNPQLEYMTISSAYRQGDRGDHGRGVKIDISEIKFQNQPAYNHATVYYNKDLEGAKAWRDYALMLKGTGILRHIISGGVIYENIVTDPGLEGVKIVQDDFQVPRYGGIHFNHYDVKFETDKDLGEYEFSLDEECVCGDEAVGGGRVASAGSFAAGVTSGKITLAAEAANLAALEAGKLNSTTVAILDKMASQTQFDNIDIISLYREPNNDFNRFHNNGDNGIAIDVGSITYNGVEYDHRAQHNNPTAEGIEAWTEFAQFLRATGAVKQIITDTPFVQPLRSLDGFKASPGQGTPQNIRIATTNDSLHEDHFHIDIVPDATVSLTPEEDTTLAREPRATQYIRALGGVVVAQAAFGSRPTSYDQLSEGHRQLLGEAAAERGFVGYEDAGGVSAQAQAALDAMTQAASREGVSLRVGSAYRSYNDQVGTYFRPAGPDVTNPIEFFWSEDLQPSEREQVKQAYVARGVASAPPGYSRHSTGLAFDFVDGGGLIQANSPQYTWLKANAERFGFVISYPEDNSGAADFEPWEWIFEGNGTYPLDVPLSELESTPREATRQAGECVCTTKQENEAVQIREASGGEEGAEADAEATPEADDNGLLQNIFTSLGLILFGGVKARADVDMRLIGSTVPDQNGNEDPAPDEYDYRVPVVRERTNDSRSTTTVIGYKYYQLRSDYNRSGVDEARLNFHREVAEVHGYAEVPDAGGLRPELRPAYDRFMEFTQEVGVDTGPMGFVDNYVNQAQQAQNFYQARGAGALSDANLWESEFDRLAFDLPARHNELRQTTQNKVLIARALNEEFGPFTDGSFNSVDLARRNILVPRSNARQQNKFEGETAYDVVLEFSHSQSNPRRTYRRFVTIEQLIARRTQVKQAYADRAFYYPPINFDDRQSGEYFSIGLPYPELIADREGSYIIIETGFRPRIDPQKLQGRLRGDGDLVEIKGRQIEDYTRESEEQIIEYLIENGGSSELDEIIVDAIRGGPFGDGYPEALPVRDLLLSGRRPNVLVVSRTDEASIGDDSNYLIYFDGVYLTSYDPEKINAYLEEQAKEVGVEVEIMKNLIFPEQIRQADNQVYVLDWLNQNAVTFGLKPSKTRFSRAQQGEIVARVNNAQAQYQIDPDTDRVVTDENNKPIPNTDFLDPGVGIDEDEYDAEEEFEKENFGLNPDENERIFRYSNSDTLAYYIEDNQSALSDSQQQRIIALASFIEQELGISVDGEPARNADGSPVTVDGRIIYPEAIDVAKVREANRVRNDINTRVSQPLLLDANGTVLVNPADQADSPRQQAYDDLSEREKEAFNALDGDFRIVPVAVNQGGGRVAYEYKIRNTTGIDIQGPGTVNIEREIDSDTPGFVKVTGASTRNLETAVFSRLNTSAETIDILEGKKPQEIDRRIKYVYDNQREAQAFNYYDNLVNNADKQEYAEEVIERTELRQETRPSDTDPNIQIRGDEEVRLELSNRLRFYTYDEKYDRTLNPDENPFVPDARSALNALVGSRDVECTRVAEEFNGKFVNPLPGATLTSGYYRTGTTNFHGAVDLSNCGLSGGDQSQTCNNEVVAAAAGEVDQIQTTAQSGGCGITVYIRHGDEARTKYCHLFEARVDVGDTVAAGDVIGIEGTTGSAAVHLHFAVFLIEEDGSQKRVNPCSEEGGLDCEAYPKLNPNVFIR